MRKTKLKIRTQDGEFENNFLKIGLASSSQKINQVPTDKYDQKLDFIVTNKYILK